MDRLWPAGNRVRPSSRGAPIWIVAARRIGQNQLPTRQASGASRLRSGTGNARGACMGSQRRLRRWRWAASHMIAAHKGFGDVLAAAAIDVAPVLAVVRTAAALLARPRKTSWYRSRLATDLSRASRWLTVTACAGIIVGFVASAILPALADGGDGGSHNFGGGGGGSGGGLGLNGTVGGNGGAGPPLPVVVVVAAAALAAVPAAPAAAVTAVQSLAARPAHRGAPMAASAATAAVVPVAAAAAAAAAASTRPSSTSPIHLRWPAAMAATAATAASIPTSTTH